MYHKSMVGVGGGVGVTTLPYTGMNVLWMVIAAFALAMAAGALLRVLPKRTRA